MTYRYLKKATLTSKSDSPETIRTVQTILDNIEAGGDIKALEYSTKYDRYYGPTILSRKDIELANSQVSENTKQIYCSVVTTSEGLLKLKNLPSQTFSVKYCQVSSLAKK